ncbi:MAG: hypothetical protein ABIH67_04575 [Candidatus Uhrbacteria bacterium]
MKKVMNSVKKLKDVIQKYPETSALIIGLVIGITCFGLSLTETLGRPGEMIEKIVNILFSLILCVLCVGGLFFCMALEIFGEKNYKELSEKALASEIKLIINTGLIQSGAAKTAADLIK